MNSFSKKIGNITISVDYRVELLGVIMLISDYSKKFPYLFGEYENKFYMDRIKEKFLKYKDEEVIKMFDELVIKHGFSYDAPYALFLQLNDNFECDKISDDIFKHRLGSDPIVYEFISKLKDFAEKINFEEYYKSNEEEYLKYINSLATAFEMYDISKFLLSYYGYGENKKFELNLIPFAADGAFAATSPNNTIHSLLPINERSKKDDLYECKGREKHIVKNPVHEFSHGFVNVLNEKYGLIDGDSNIFEDIFEVMKKNAYGSNYSILNEFIIRAIVARYILITYKDEEHYNKEINRTKEWGFIYIDNIIESLIEYENNRDKYKTFDDYFPILVENFIKYIEQQRDATL